MNPNSKDDAPANWTWHNTGEVRAIVIEQVTAKHAGTVLVPRQTGPFGSLVGALQLQQLWLCDQHPEITEWRPIPVVTP